MKTYRRSTNRFLLICWWLTVYFKYGINLNTETPTPEQIRDAVTEILTKDMYARNVKKLSKEFELYNPNELTAGYPGELLSKN
jgi:hypothetical protein